MPHAYSRTRRVAEQIHRELADILEKKATDPRFQSITITGVEVSPDYSNCVVFVTILDDAQRESILTALNKAAGFFRHEVAVVLNMRTTPKIKFIYDESFVRGRRIADLLEKINKKKES